MKTRTMKTMLRATMLAMTLTFGASAPVYASDDAAVVAKEDVDAMASFLVSDDFILSRLELREICQDPVAALEKIALSKRSKKLARERAIQSLALYGREDARVGEALEELLSSLEPTSKLFATPLVAYGESEGEDAVATIAPLARHESARVRMAAVIALGRYGGQTGYDMLGELAESETDEKVRARIESYR